MQCFPHHKVMKQVLLLTLGLTAILALDSCNGSSSKPNPENRNYETGYSSRSTVTESVEDDPYIDNSLSTGSQPYQCRNYRGDESSIEGLNALMNSFKN